MSSAYAEISCEELGDYFGKKAVIRVDKKWLDSIMCETGGSKECSKCKKALPINDFNADKRRKFGRRSQCKNCYKDTPANTPQSKVASNEDLPKIEFKLTNFNDK